jgi:hypothetical protein
MGKQCVSITGPYNANPVSHDERVAAAKNIAPKRTPAKPLPGSSKKLPKITSIGPNHVRSVAELLGVA